jgi:hypothetical protein
MVHLGVVSVILTVKSTYIAHSKYRTSDCMEKPSPGGSSGTETGMARVAGDTIFMIFYPTTIRND